MGHPLVGAGWEYGRAGGQIPYAALRNDEREGQAGANTGVLCCAQDDGVERATARAGWGRVYAPTLGAMGLRRRWGTLWSWSGLGVRQGQRQKQIPPLRS